MGQLVPLRLGGHADDGELGARGEPDAVRVPGVVLSAAACEDPG